MRIKDDKKEQTIVQTTVSLINKIGFANISMSKIAKSAGVSSSTLYTYFESKEDMLVKVYTKIKMQMLIAGQKDIDPKDPIQVSVWKFCENIVSFMQEHPDYFLFLEQSNNAPVISDAAMDEIHMVNSKLYAIFIDGIKQGLLKDAAPEILVGFCFYPITQIYKDSCQFHSDTVNIDFDLIFQMCWDAIKK